MIPTYCNQAKTYNGTLNISIAINSGGGKGNRYGRGFGAIAKTIGKVALELAAEVIIPALPKIIEKVSNAVEK